MSTKVKTIHIENYKALSLQDFEFNGASAIITGGNNKGKSSALRDLIKRFQGEKADIIVKQGEEKGENIMELTDGCKIGWKFTKKSETFYYITADDIKMTTGVLSAIGEKYFGNKFDIDKFVRSSGNEQNKQVQALLKIDLSEIEARYKEKFDLRTDANREVKRLLALDKEKPEEISAPDIEALKNKKEDIKSANTELKEVWENQNKLHQKSTQEFNALQSKLKSENEFLEANLIRLNEMRGTPLEDCIDFSKAEKIVSDKKEPQELKPLTSLPEPIYKDIEAVDKEIEDAYSNKAKFDAYEKDLKEYTDWVSDGKKARKKVDKLKEQLDKINAEKFEKIKSANLPKEFDMTDDGLMYNGLPLDDNQISSSAKYISALKLGYLALGKLRTMHFDASFLDKDSLSEVQKWAEEHDLQLLIERADWENGDIKYEIIEK